MIEYDEKSKVTEIRFPALKVCPKCGKEFRDKEIQCSRCGRYRLSDKKIII